jgi:UDP-N-acetyl-2-amino-2-deoxyglucuronate dehydrogenase
MKTLRFALMGCGRIAKRHADLLSTGSVRGATLAAVCDIRQDRAKSFGEKYNVPFYEDIHKLIKSEQIDVISVLTPSGLHAEHVLSVAGHRKHILVEKPMALSLADADSMIRACDINGVKLFVVKQNRFNLPVMKLREAIVAGRFGKLVLGTVRLRWCRPQSYYDSDSWRGKWALDGGVLANQASHHIDLLEWMMGSVKTVFGMSTTALVNIEAEDTAVVNLRFSSGALGIIEATTAARPKDLEGSISILGEKGSVEIAGFAVNQIRSWNFESETEEDRNVIKNFSNNPPDVYGYGHKAYLENIVECIENGRSGLVEGLEGRKSLELISAIYESIEQGREVPLRFEPKLCRLGQR